MTTQPMDVVSAEWEVSKIVPMMTAGRLTIQVTFWQPKNLAEPTYILEWFIEDFVGDSPAELAKTVQLFVDALHRVDGDPRPPVGNDISLGASSKQPCNVEHNV